MANLIITSSSMNTHNSDESLNEQLHSLIIKFKAEYIHKPVKTIKQKVIWTLKYIVLPTLYIYAVIKPDFENFRQALLIMMAFLLGLFQVLRIGIKFSKEFIDLLVQWRKENIKIEGGRWVYFLIALSAVMVIVGIVIIFLLISSK